MQNNTVVEVLNMLKKRVAGANNIQSIIFVLAMVAIAGTLAVGLYFVIHRGATTVNTVITKDAHQLW